MIYISIILIIISGVSKAIQDTCASNFKYSKLKKLNPYFWNKSASSMNKWKDGDKQKGEKFLFSSTLLVFITDAWHIFDTLRDLTIVLSLILYPHLMLVILFYPIRQLFFEISYRYLNNDFDKLLGLNKK